MEKMRALLAELKKRSSVELSESAGAADEKGQNGGYHLNINLNINQ